MRWTGIRLAALLAPCIASASVAPASAVPPDRVPRTAIISAFEPEFAALRSAITAPHERTFAGTRFVTGTLSGRPVLLFLSGMSMVNAAMVTQLALDHYRVTRIVFSGIAGGIDPALAVGDVVVPDRWAQYLESTFARAEGDHFAPPEGLHYALPDWPNYGMIYPRAVEVRPAGSAAPERRRWFEADPALVAIARRAAAGTTLGRCAGDLCLHEQPRVVVGGTGISGPVFMDNAEYRAYAFRTFHAQVLDMETAAVGQVAYVNRVPFIGFRSLSDLAGGDPGSNQAPVFFRLASENSATVVKAFIAALPPG